VARIQGVTLGAAALRATRMAVLLPMWAGEGALQQTSAGVLPSCSAQQLRNKAMHGYYSYLQTGRLTIAATASRAAWLIKPACFM
jgi:hypothetical protein